MIFISLVSTVNYWDAKQGLIHITELQLTRARWNAIHGSEPIILHFLIKRTYKTNLLKSGNGVGPFTYTKIIIITLYACCIFRATSKSMNGSVRGKCRLSLIPAVALPPCKWGFTAYSINRMMSPVMASKPTPIGPISLHPNIFQITLYRIRDRLKIGCTINLRLLAPAGANYFADTRVWYFSFYLSNESYVK